MKVASEKIPTSGVGVVSVSLADNNLRDISPVADLASYFPNLKNLSLQNNQIGRWTDLDLWATQRKFPQLQELLLLDNPLQRNARDPDEYQRQCARRFPSLKVLDGTPLATVKEISFGVGPTANRVTELPAKIRQGAWGEGSNEIGVGFLSTFFPLFDTNRTALLQQFYTPTSLFSVSVDTFTPHQRPERRGAFSGPSQGGLLGAYIPQSRNLIRAKGEHARMTKLHQGRDQIAQAFQHFPPTKHPIDVPAAFVADGFQVQIGASAGIMVVVHGEFMEMTGRQDFRRSFDRTFLLGPPVPATNPGAQCVVVSDLLIWRPFSGREAWVPEEGPGPAEPALPPVPEGMVDERHEIVQELLIIAEVRRRTQLNEQFARLLLQECNGDVEAGVRRFEEAKVCPLG
jgi:nuclear RNA export factor